MYWIPLKYYPDLGQTIAPAGERKTLLEYSLAHKNERKSSNDRLLCLGVDMR
jgi:hypothetical protein